MTTRNNKEMKLKGRISKDKKTCWLKLTDPQLEELAGRIAVQILHAHKDRLRQNIISDYGVDPDDSSDESDDQSDDSSVASCDTGCDKTSESGDEDENEDEYWQCEDCKYLIRKKVGSF